MHTIRPAKEIRGTVALPSNPDFVTLAAVMTLVTRVPARLGPLTPSPLLDSLASTFAPVLDFAWEQDRLTITARDSAADVLLPPEPLYCRDFVVFALLAAGRAVRCAVLSDARIQRWSALATRARCTLEVTSDDAGARISLGTQPDSAPPLVGVTADDLHPILGLALGLRTSVSITVEFAPATPLRHLFTAYGLPFDVRNSAERATDPIAKRILRMKGKPLTTGGAQTFAVQTDCSTTTTSGVVDIELPGDEVLGAILLAAKTIVQRGNLIIENMPLEVWSGATAQVLRRMGSNPAIQQSKATTFGQTGMIQLQRFSAAGRRVECLPHYQYELQLPAMMAGAMFAEGESVFRGLTEMRADGPDSVASILTFLRTVNAHHGEMPDGIVVRGATQYDGFDLSEALPAHMAGAWCVTALRSIGESSIEQSGILARWPGFFSVLDSICEYRG